MTTFYKCNLCGNIVGLIKNGGGPLACCDTGMPELAANTADASQEKHVPVIRTDGNKVTVTIGSVPHPMEESHYISFIYLCTEQGGQRKALKAGDSPQAVFILADGDTPVAAYEYCNLHGLWKAPI